MRSKALPPARAQGHIVPFLEAAALFAALCIFARTAALMLAALAASGETAVRGYSYVCRGYEHICEDLAALGGRLKKDTGNYFYGKNTDQ